MNRYTNKQFPFPGRRPFAIRKQFGPDRIGFVGFHEEGFVIAKPADAFASWLQQRAAALPDRISGSCTNLAAGLDMSLAMLRRTPPGVLKRVWLLTDGLPNMDNHRVGQLVRDAKNAHVNINTIAFGDPRYCDTRLLRRISSATHNGYYFSIDNLRDLSDALIRGGGLPKPSSHRSETTILCVDLSGSMLGPMNGHRKIDVVVEAIMALLRYKQQVWS